MPCLKSTLRRCFQRQLNLSPSSNIRMRFGNRSTSRLPGRHILELRTLRSHKSASIRFGINHNRVVGRMQTSLPYSKELREKDPPRRWIALSSHDMPLTAFHPKPTRFFRSVPVSVFDVSYYMAATSNVVRETRLCKYRYLKLPETIHSSISGF